MRTLVAILVLLMYSLSACTSSQSAEGLVRSLPVMPQASTPRQSGSMLDYSVPDACSEVAAFYQTEMALAGWTLSEAYGPGDSWQRLEFAAERDSAEIHLSASPLGQPECSVQVFYHKYTLLRNPLVQRSLVILAIVGIEGVFAYKGGRLSIGKGRPPAIGWLLGFFLGPMGDLFILSWEPRRDTWGRMIGWDEYKHYSKEQKQAIRATRPAPVPVSPTVKRIRIIAVIVFVVFVR